MKKNKAKSKKTSVRYDDAKVKAIASFMRAGHSNAQTKIKFGCSAHWAGHLRKKMKIAGAKPAVKAKTAKPKKGKVKKTVRSSLI